MKSEPSHSSEFILHLQARSAFVQKVYSTLSIQLLITAAIVALNFNSATFAYIQERYTLLGWVMLGVTLFSIHKLGTPLLT
jgi:FtsH-binding integral membrane protein